MYRDIGEITKQNPQSQALAAELLTPANSSLDEMIENLSDEQEEMLLILMRDISKCLHEQGS